MRAAITRTSEFPNSVIEDEKEFNSLEELIDFRKQLGETDIIIREPFRGWGEYYDFLIEIYDDYRE